MKARLLLIAAAVLMGCSGAAAQNALNRNADSIIGEYYLPDAKNGDSKAEFTKAADGTYECRITWIKDPLDPRTGKPWVDARNPDKSLRTRPVVGIKFVEGLRYDSKAQNWSGATIYDPNRGIKAKATACFTSDGRLAVSGKVLGIGETVYWKKLR